MDELEAARLLAHSEKQSGAAVSAVNSKIKLMGLDKPRRIDHTSSDGSMTPKAAIDTSKLSTSALEEILNAATDDG